MVLNNREKKQKTKPLRKQLGVVSIIPTIYMYLPPASMEHHNKETPCERNKKKHLRLDSLRENIYTPALSFISQIPDTEKGNKECPETKGGHFIETGWSRDTPQVTPGADAQTDHRKSTLARGSRWRPRWPGAQSGTIHPYHFRWEFLPKPVL